MKKRISRILAVLLVLTMVFSLTACGKKTDSETKNDGGSTTTTQAPANTDAGTQTPATNDTPVTNDTPATDVPAQSELPAGTYDITVWVSESDGVTDLTAKQIKRFAEDNGITINATVEGITEAESASQMITSVEDGADLYCFAQDQLSRLVQAGALTKLGDGAVATVKALNDATSIKASTVGDSLYCYPLTSDNGYFMYYDTSVIPEADLDSLEALIADCEAAGRNFSMELTTSAWYNAAFFFATGCHSEWETAEDGKSFLSVSDDFNSEAGVVALKGMQKLLKSPIFVSSSAGGDFSLGSAVLISGTWASSAVKESLGVNYGATDLPSFTVDGKEYHLGSYSGCKLMGIKPQIDADKAQVLQALALYLTNCDCQLERFDLVGWGPSNLEAQADDLVASDVALAALAKQAAYATPQGNIHGSWWDIAKTYAVDAKEATTDDELRATLQLYADTINALFGMSVDEQNAWSLIGSMNGDSWATDIEMSCDSTGVWHSDAIFFDAADEFKARQGKSWTVNIGQGVLDGPNYTVPETGYYYVTFTYDEASETGELILEKTSDMFGFSVIGSMYGDGWTIDYPMAIQADGSYKTVDPIDFVDGDEFKCRLGKSWDVNYGDGADNFKAVAGSHYVCMTADGVITLE